MIAHCYGHGGSGMLAKPISMNLKPSLHLPPTYTYPQSTYYSTDPDGSFLIMANKL